MQVCNLKKGMPFFFLILQIGLKKTSEWAVSSKPTFPTGGLEAGAMDLH